VIGATVLSRNDINGVSYLPGVVDMQMQPEPIALVQIAVPGRDGPEEGCVLSREPA
jgi:hypothetical protein